VGRVVGDEIAGFGGDTVTGGNEIGPWAYVSTDNVEGVADVGTKGGFADAAAAEEMIPKGVQRGMTTGTGEAG
jgi:hypothetical protein